MSNTIDSILETIKNENVKYVDLRFTDTKGKEQHISIPASLVDEDFFEDGKMFDGSSIAGWKGISKSDMVLMPDISTWQLDPFFEYKTYFIRCDVLEPKTLLGYERDPRSVAKKAEKYLKSTGIADSVIFGPEPEFFIFDDVRYQNEMNGCFYKVDSEDAAWNTGKSYDDYDVRNLGHRHSVKGGYFPVPPVDVFQDIRSEICERLTELGFCVEAHHHEADERHQVPAARDAVHAGVDRRVARPDAEREPEQEREPARAEDGGEQDVERAVGAGAVLHPEDVLERELRHGVEEEAPRHGDDGEKQDDMTEPFHY